MKNRLISIISLIVLLGLVAWYLSDPSRRDVLSEQISSIGWSNFCLVSLGAFGFIFFQGFVLKHSVSPYGIKLSFLEHFGIIIVTFFSNYMVPFMGFGARGVYLKKKHGLRYKDFSQSLIGVLVIEWAIFALIAVVAAATLLFTGKPISYLLVLLMVAILCGFVFLFAVRPSWIPNFLPLSKLMKKGLADWQSYTEHRRALGFVAFYTLLEAICFAFTFVVAYKALFPDVPFAASVFAASLSDLALIIRILPASAGSLEGALQLSMLPYGLEFSDNLSVALISRAALAVIFIPLGPIFFWRMLRRRAQKAS